MKGGPNRDHQLEALGDGGEGRGGRPGVEAGRLDALDVVEIQFGDERKIKADLLAAAREAADVGPAGLHLLVVDIAEPAAEDRHPVAESQFASSDTRATSASR